MDEDAPTQALDVHVYVDGKLATQVVADRARADIGRAFPGAGSLHGYSATLDVAPGTHQVCTYAITPVPGP